MSESAALRKLAEQLREEATRRDVMKREKCAQTVVALNGLEVLRRKLGGSNVG